VRGRQNTADLADRDERSGARADRVFDAVLDLEFGESNRIGRHGVADAGGRDGYLAGHLWFSPRVKIAPADARSPRKAHASSPPNWPFRQSRMAFADSHVEIAGEINHSWCLEWMLL
jgi:hypothetical protein